MVVCRIYALGCERPATDMHGAVQARTGSKGQCQLHAQWQLQGPWLGAATDMAARSCQVHSSGDQWPGVGLEVSRSTAEGSSCR